MALPFLECLVLVGIHSYLGIHVLKRKVIFVDLALAQIAALGTIVAFMFNLAPHSLGAYVFSLLFTFVGAAVFSLTRVRQEKIPQEAVIGLVYALAASIAILLIDRAPHGAEHISKVLTGTIMYVEAREVMIAAAVYLGVGIFHYAFRARFLLISNAPDEAYRRNIRVRLWDFLFYMSFGLVITVSVHTAGVLLVFVFLVVPAILALVLTDRLLFQLLIGWSLGAAVSFVGLVACYLLDTPPGPMVIAAYGIALVLAALILYVWRAPARGPALARVGVGGLVTALVVLGFYGLGGWFSAGQGMADNHGHSAHLHHHAHHDGAGEHGAGGALAAAPDSVAALLAELSELDIVGKETLLARQSDSALVKEAYAKAEDDDELRLVVAARLVELDSGAGCAALLQIVERGEIKLFRGEAAALLKSSCWDGFGLDLEDPASEANAAALARWHEWLSAS